MTSRSTPSIRSIVADLRDGADNNEWSVSFGNPAVSSERLAEVEKELRCRLPDDLKEFYSIADGMDIDVVTKYDASTSSVSVFSINLLLLYTKSLYEYTDQVRRPDRARTNYSRFIAFGNLLDGDLCCLDLDRPANGRPYTIIATDHEQPQTWPSSEPIASSICFWLKKILNCAREREFLTYWEVQDTRSWPPDAKRPPNSIR